MYLLLYHVYNGFPCRKWHWYSFIEQSCRGKTVFVVVWKTYFFNLICCIWTLLIFFFCFG